MTTENTDLQNVVVKSLCHCFCIPFLKLDVMLFNTCLESQSPESSKLSKKISLLWSSFIHGVFNAALCIVTEAGNIGTGSESRRSDRIETCIVSVTHMIELFKQVQKFKKYLVHPVPKPRQLCVLRTSWNHYLFQLVCGILDFSFKRLSAQQAQTPWVIL